MTAEEIKTWPVDRMDPYTNITVSPADALRNKFLKQIAIQLAEIKELMKLQYERR